MAIIVFTVLMVGAVLYPITQSVSLFINKATNHPILFKVSPLYGGGSGTPHTHWTLFFFFIFIQEENNAFSICRVSHDYGGGNDAALSNRISIYTPLSHQRFHCSHGGGSNYTEHKFVIPHNTEDSKNTIHFSRFHLLYGGGSNRPVDALPLLHCLVNDAPFTYRVFTFLTAGAVIHPMLT